MVAWAGSRSRAEWRRMAASVDKWCLCRRFANETSPTLLCSLCEGGVCDCVAVVVAVEKKRRRKRKKKCRIKIKIIYNNKKKNKIKYYIYIYIYI